MSETVLVMPLFMVVLAFLTYFGQGMVRVQHASVMDRYEAWRQVASVSGEGDPWGPHPIGTPGAPGGGVDYRQLNETFFVGNADQITGSNSNTFPDDAPDELVTRTRFYSPDGSALLERIFEDLPAGRSVTFSTSHTNSVRLFEPLEGPITRSHTRMGNDWRFVNGQSLQEDDTWRPSGPRVSHTQPIVEEFFLNFDEQMEFLAGGGNNYAGIVRGLYRSQPGYAGPEVPIP